MSTIRRSLRAARGIVAAAIVTCSALSAGAQQQPAGAGASGLAYDEITRILTDATPPPPDSFDVDAARIAALPQAPSMGGVNQALSTISALNKVAAIPLAGILTGPAQMAAMMALDKASKAYTADVTAMGHAYMVAGGMQSAAFYRGWNRQDSPQLHRAVIERPDRGETITLNLTQKTYRRVVTPTAAATEETYTVSDDGQATSTLLSGTIEALATLTIAGHPARGYKTTATFSLSQKTTWCASGSHDLVEVEYVADIPDPRSSGGMALTAAQAAAEACAPTTAASHREPGRLVVFRSVSLTGTPLGNIVRVTERGNLRTLTASDAAMFDIPPTFTEEPGS